MFVEDMALYIYIYIKIVTENYEMYDPHKTKKKGQSPWSKLKMEKEGMDCYTK